MRRGQNLLVKHGAAVLLVCNLALVLGLVAVWMDWNGQWRNIRWVAPNGQPVALAEAKLLNGASASDQDIGRYMVVLDKPLFSPTRRPPPPPPPPAPPPPVDPLANIQLLGVYGGKDVGGIIARIDGKVQRVHLKETVGPWTITEIHDRNVTFVNGDQTRVLTLVHVVAPRATTQAAADPAPMPLGRPDVAAIQQREHAEVQKRMDERRELFKKLGIPLIGKE